MASEPATTLTFTELVALLEAHPEETRRHELIDGELFVSPPPFNRHQRVVGEIFAFLREYARVHGGITLPGGGLYYDEHNYVEPDVLFVGPDHLDRVTERYTVGPPDLAVEVSSDATRRWDLVRKRDLYARSGVGEYWFVDLRAEHVLVHRPAPGFDRPATLRPGDTLTSPLLPGLAIPLSEVLTAFPS